MKTLSKITMKNTIQLYHNENLIKNLYKKFKVIEKIETFEIKKITGIMNILLFVKMINKLLTLFSKVSK